MDPSLRRSLPRVLGPEGARRLGITPDQSRTELRRGTWRRLATGVVLTRPDDPTREDWARTGLLLAGPGSAVTGWDAVNARGLGPRRPPSDLVVVLSTTAMNRVVGNARIRRTARPYRASTAPLGSALELAPLAAMSRAVPDAALQCHHLGDVRALVGAAVQRQMCTVAELLDEFSACPRNNSRLLRIALTDVRDGARSAAEATAARKLARGPIPPFELNVPVVDQNGSVLFIVDALWRELRAALEIDSREYHFGLADWLATLDRHNQLTRYGLAVTHYAPTAVTRRGSTFVPDVADWLNRRAAELGVPLPGGRGVQGRGNGREPEPYVVQTRTA